jgi:cell division septation protein DedD
MKGEIVTFQLHRIGVALLVIGSLLLAVLIFAAGYITGTATIKPPSSATRNAQPAAPPPPTTTTAPATAPAPTEEPLALRVGMFANEDDARALVQQLAAAGMKPSIVTIQSSAAVLYTVQVGPYKTRAEADAAAAALQKQQGIGVVVVPAGSHL